MTVKLLNEHDLEFLHFKRGCTGSSESTLVKRPHCWKSHVTAHIKYSPSHSVKSIAVKRCRTFSGKNSFVTS